MRGKLLAVLIILVVSLAGVSFSNEERSGGGEEKMISFSVKRLKNVYLFNKKMPIEINFKNKSKYSVKLCKVFVNKEELLFRLKLNEEHLVDEKTKTRYNLSLLRRAKIDPSPKSIVTLKPREEYKTEIDIAEMVKELELKPGTYKVRLIYTMWISMLKEEPEYAKNAEGKTREWESNEIEITLKE